jgi:hypothetical protein
MCFFSTTNNTTTERSATAAPPLSRRFVARRALFCCAWTLVVFSSAASVRPVGAVLLDFEGVGRYNLVGDFYAGGGGGPSKNYGITFGASARGTVDADAGGDSSMANEPSPNTTLILAGEESQAYLTAPDGFTALSFQYATQGDFTATVYGGPNLTGTVLATTGLVPTGDCDPNDCGDPTGNNGVWFNVTVPFSGVAQSVGFSTSNGFVLIDDMRVEVPTAPPTAAPTGRPTKAPFATRRPARSSACPRKGMKGGGPKKCKAMMLMMMMMKK